MNLTLLSIRKLNHTIFVSSARSTAISTVALALVLTVASGCATTREPAPGFTPRPQPADRETPGYETPPILNAAEVVPAEWLNGPHHQIDPFAINDGYYNHFLVRSDFGDFPAVGRIELEERLKEVAAIAVLREMNGREAYGKGVVAGGKRTALTPVRQVKRYVKNPLHIVEAIPGEAMRAVGIFEDVRKLARMGLTKAYLKDLIGYDDARKDLAKRLDVDPNTPNPVLHTELNHAAWAYYGGSAPMYLLEELMPLVPIPHVTLIAGGESLGEAVDTFDKEVGRKSVNTQLRRMGVTKADRKALRQHPAYSSRDRKNLARSLFGMKNAAGRDTFIQHAIEAETKEDARAMIREVQTIAVYDETFDEIVELAYENGAVLCYTRSGVVMMPILADYVAWTEDFANRVDSMSAWTPEDGEVAAREIWVAGAFTPWARHELDARTIAVTDNAVLTLMKALEEKEAQKKGFLAKLRRNKAGRVIDRIANAGEN